MPGFDAEHPELMAWPEIPRLVRLSLRERFEWWIGGGRLPDGTHPRGWSELLSLLFSGLWREINEGQAWSEAEKDRYLRAACDVLSYVEEHGLIEEDELLNRQLMLSTGLAKSEFSFTGKGYDAEDAIRRIMAVLTPERIDECERLSPGWTKLSTPEIARLHRVKQLIKIAGEMRDHLVDPEMRAVVLRWEPLYPRLP
ncbi:MULTISPECIES: hypothetical protein [Amycolatopsis]|uniref:Uncharacterized protein n=1 Tax=Amycolatopsis albidoflavus TaxID=102226 RepID=A0ABW5HQC0_9PSEU